MNGQEVLDKVSSGTWDVIVLDINMPRRNGFDVLRHLARDYPQVPVLVLSVYPEGQLGIHSLRAGAAGYLTKDSAPQELLDAIRTVCSGRKYISSPLAQQLAERLTEDPRVLPHSWLTEREFEVFRHIVQGKSVNEIAELLAVSVRTVRTYRSRIFEKMKMENDVQLARYASEHHLL